jgi:hypothetical protein
MSMVMAQPSLSVGYNWTIYDICVTLDALG